MTDKVQQPDSVQEQALPLPGVAAPLAAPPVDAIWKGENESDGEYAEDQDIPLEY